MLRVLLAVIQKDLKQYFTDRRAVLISLAVPLGIGCFMAAIFGGQAASGGKPASKVTVLVVSQSPEDVKPLLERWKKVESIEVKETTEADAREQVKSGKVALAVVIPDGFLGQASAAFGESGTAKPELKFISDPSKKMEAGIAQGGLMSGIMGAVVANKYGGQFAPDTGDTTPFTTKTDDLSAEKKQDAEDSRNATVAHVFCGMAMQGILFGAIEAAMLLMRDRQKGLLKRLTAAPISPKWFLLGRILSSTLKSLFVLIIVLLAGKLLFHFPIAGNPLGLALVLAFSALMSATFGLFVAALGRTEAQSRGLATLVVLVMTMLGGAWFPAFMFPGWVQAISKCIPARWAIDGLDAMTWRGLGLSEVLPAVGVLAIFSVVFALIGLYRFRWEAEGS